MMVVSGAKRMAVNGTREMTKARPNPMASARHAESLSGGERKGSSFSGGVMAHRLSRKDQMKSMPRFALPVLTALTACVHPVAVLTHPENPEWTRQAPPVSHLRFETTKGV